MAGEVQRLEQNVERNVVELHPRRDDLDVFELVDDAPAAAVADGPRVGVAEAADQVGAVAVGRPRLRQVLRREWIAGLPVVASLARWEAHRTRPPMSAKKLMIAAAPPMTSAAAAETSAPDRPRADQWWLLPCEASAQTPAPMSTPASAASSIQNARPLTRSCSTPLPGRPLGSGSIRTLRGLAARNTRITERLRG